MRSSIRIQVSGTVGFCEPLAPLLVVVVLVALGAAGVLALVVVVVAVTPGFWVVDPPVPQATSISISMSSEAATIHHSELRVLLLLCIVSRSLSSVLVKEALRTFS